MNRKELEQNYEAALQIYQRLHEITCYNANENHLSTCKDELCPACKARISCLQIINQYIARAGYDLSVAEREENGANKDSSHDTDMG
jgi:hypothetical protein